MNRTLGFFVGSAVVFMLLVLVLGQPVSLAPPGDRDQMPTSDTMNHSQPVKLPANQRQASAASEDSITEAALSAPELPIDRGISQTPAAPPPGTAVSAGLPSGSPDPESLTAPAPAELSAPAIEDQDENNLAEAWLASRSTEPAAGNDGNEASDASEPFASPGAVSDAGNAAQPGPRATELEWFPVWDPFHSELSANAFARRLERVTGLDYRVIKTGPAQYRVTMGYASEEQRIANMGLIEEATGLIISGGSR